MNQPAVETRKDQILRVAGKRFAASGFNGTSMRDIAGDIGIEAATLYAHFSGKDNLLHEICFRKSKQFMLAIEDVNDLYFNAEQKLRMAIHNHVEIITGDVDAAHVFFNEWKHLKEADLNTLKQLRHQYEQAFRQIITEGENENLFEETDKQFAVLTILSSVNWISEWYNPEGKLKPAEIADKITDFILKGLRK